MEDTTRIQTEEQEEERAIVERMKAEVKSAPEPGETKVGLDVSGEVGEGDVKANIPAVVSAVTSAGYSYLYNTRTGDMSKFNNNMLPRVVKQKWSDNPLMGKPVWSVRPPINPPLPVKVGKLLCMLHKDAPNRDRFNEMGFAVCPKDNLASPYQVRRHMMKKHRDEWAAIEDMRKERERDEDRKLTRAQLKSLTKKK